MAVAERKDPYDSYNFTVEIDGIARAAFQQCSGFDSTIDVVEHREGGENTTPRKLPGLTKHSPIMLKWGMTDDKELYDWHRQAVEGNIQRRNGSIIGLNRLGVEVARWNFFNAWPTKYDGPDFNAETSDVAIESMEIVHEGLVRVS